MRRIAMQIVPASRPFLPRCPGIGFRRISAGLGFYRLSTVFVLILPPESFVENRVRLFSALKEFERSRRNSETIMDMGIVGTMGAVRIFAVGLDLKAISDELGIQPSETHRTGEHRLTSRPYSQDMWSVESP